jgi:hypothetical protein
VSWQPSDRRPIAPAFPVILVLYRAPDGAEILIGGAVDYGEAERRIVLHVMEQLYPRGDAEICGDMDVAQIQAAAHRTAARYREVRGQYRLEVAW